MFVHTPRRTPRDFGCGGAWDALGRVSLSAGFAIFKQTSNCRESTL